MKEQFSPAAGRLKKTLALAVLSGLMLTGCGGKQAVTQPTATATATSVSATTEMVTVPGVVNLTLDKATDQLEKLGFKVEAADTAHGKSVDVKKNWQVVSQDPASGAQAPKGSPVRLGVKSLDDLAAEKAAADKAAADKAAAAAKAAADKAAADKAAADQAAAAKAAADRAAADQAAQAAAAQQAPQAPAPAPVAVPAAPAAAYYANCTAAKAAGAAPLYRGQPGYRSALDRDGDGVACER